MKKRMLIVTLTVCVVIACVGVMFAQAPVVNIYRRHGNLRAAQIAIVQAYQKIDAAQRDNDDQLGGHAQRAKDLLTQADQELRLAADVANREGR
jgi:Tfp pilus assembly protein PilX